MENKTRNISPLTFFGSFTENPSTFYQATVKNDFTEMEKIKDKAYDNEVIDFEDNTFNYDHISITSIDDNEKKLDESLNSSLPSSRMRKLRRNTIRSKSLKRKSGVDEIDIVNEKPNQVSFLEPIVLDDYLTDHRPREGVSSSIEATITRLQSIQQTTHLSRWQHFKLNNAIRWLHFRRFLGNFRSFFNIWKGHMKEIEGMFGSGVVSYFILMRWLLMLNVLVCIILLSFLFVPQIIFSQSSKSQRTSFTGMELLTGDGWFAQSELFYGTYTNQTIKNGYEMQHAYLLAGGGYIFIVIFIMAVSMAKSYNENYIFSGESAGLFSSKVFCSWDYGITNQSGAKMKCQSIAQDLLETLGSERYSQDLSLKKLCNLILIRLVTNTIVLIFIAGAIYLIYYVSELGKLESESIIYAMLPAITISSINLFLPPAFRLIASMESYQSAANELQITLMRTTLLKFASLIAYVVLLYKKISEYSNINKSFCWENYSGKAFYKLVIVDFISLLIAIFFGEFVRNVLVTHLNSLKYLGLPGFDISRNALDLIYSQAVCWLGTFHCPLLPVIVVLKLMITFYAKKFSLIHNCRPTMRPFKARKMNLVFLVLLFMMLVFVVIVTGYNIMSTNKLKPSTQCGPFRGMNSIYDIVSIIVEKLPKVISDFIKVISSAAVIAAITFLMFFVAYYFRIKKLSCEKKIELMKKQIKLVGQDKQYLMVKLRYVLKENVHLD
ncbi:transmembrane channel-like protein 7 isoform X1 [Hydra vulgaris]|uniref:transmembrane channel-like protein 7 isoform X1 n=1 Tax=Hydra vulgaris TaxID=6087 RepID=UPI001F5E5F1E|nr:transmembrane channel-like protein 7 isoform X1 [Hydra vulgaris]